MLNRQQFKTIAANTLANGGDTIDVKTGDRPTSGVMVGVKGFERSTRPPQSYSADHAESYVNDHLELLTRPAMHFGTWHDEDKDRVTEDIAMRYPNVFVGLHEAEKAEQDAVYDLTSGETIPTHGKEHARRRGYAGPLRYRDAL